MYDGVDARLTSTPQAAKSGEKGLLTVASVSQEEIYQLCSFVGLFSGINPL